MKLLIEKENGAEENYTQALHGQQANAAREGHLTYIYANGRRMVHGCDYLSIPLVGVEESMFKWILKCECQFHGLASQQQRG